jgi:hypothetical protein
MLTNIFFVKIICDHLRQNRLFDPFSKLFSVSTFWTFLKMSKFHFPFDFSGKSCYCDGEAKKTNLFCYLL